MDSTIASKQVQRIATVLSLCFLPIHVAMFLLFSHWGVTPMAIVNVVSVSFYLLTFVFIYKEMFRTYTVTVYLEVVTHMTLAVVFVGWEAGFQVSLIGISFLAFFAEYLGRSLHMRSVPAILLCMIGMLAYVFGFEYVSFHPAPYSLPSDVVFWLQVAWGFTVFIITVSFLQLFVHVTFEAEQVLSTQVMHDSLTGLPNRYYMSEYLERRKRAGNLDELWVAMVDIDDFKRVNDTYGHNCGDFVLKTLARLLRSGKGSAELCRWGGEEFLLVGTVEGGLDEQLQSLDRLRMTVGGYGFWYEEHRLNITVTMGVASYEAGMSIEEWVNVADKKLYEGKTSGKNRLVA